MNEKTKLNDKNQVSAKQEALDKARMKAGQDLNQQTYDEEVGGYSDMKKPEPTRYGDWETNGRCSDF